MTTRIGNLAVIEPVGDAHLFVDLSNVFRGAQDAARGHHELPWATRLQAEHVVALLGQERVMPTRLVVANCEVPLPVRQRFVGAGFEVETRELGNRTLTEQANDERLLVRLYETITDRARPRGTIVLATGDGNGWKKGHGFSIAIERAFDLGWNVELFSWRENLNAHLRDVVLSRGGRVELLDDSYYSITFVEDGRRAQRVIRWTRPARPAA